MTTKSRNTIIKRGRHVELDSASHMIKIDDELPDQVRDDSRWCHAFTLIELLVVVLIIGILSAVALPQYQFAVDKTRMMLYFQHLQTIVKAQQIYYLANGTYTMHLGELDLDLTQICPRRAGTYSDNELADCPGGFGINLGSSRGLHLIYCQSSSSHCSSAQPKRHLTLTWNITTNKLAGCTAQTSRGQKLCNYFQKQSGTSH